MNTDDIKDEFSRSNRKFDEAYYSGENRNLATAIFHGLKLIALAIVYHANKK